MSSIEKLQSQVKLVDSLGVEGIELADESKFKNKVLQKFISVNKYYNDELESSKPQSIQPLKANNS